MNDKRGSGTAGAIVLLLLGLLLLLVALSGGLQSHYTALIDWLRGPSSQSGSGTPGTGTVAAADATQTAPAGAPQPTPSPKTRTTTVPKPASTAAGPEITFPNGAQFPIPDFGAGGIGGEVPAIG